MNSVGIGVIGLGLAAKPHALALRDLQASMQVRVHGGYSPSAQWRTHFAATHGLPVVDSLDALLHDKAVQAVIILTPPNTHAELALQAARAGKHVLLEKPMEVTYTGARALNEAVAATGKSLGIVFQFRFRPGALRLRELMAGRPLGDLISVSASVRWWRSAQYYGEPGRGMKARDGGGVLITQAIHTLDPRSRSPARLNGSRPNAGPAHCERSTARTSPVPAWNSPMARSACWTPSPLRTQAFPSVLNSPAHRLARFLKPSGSRCTCTINRLRSSKAVCRGAAVPIPWRSLTSPIGSLSRTSATPSVTVAPRSSAVRQHYRYMP